MNLITIHSRTLFLCLCFFLPAYTGMAQQLSSEIGLDEELRDTFYDMYKVNKNKANIYLLDKMPDLREKKDYASIRFALRYIFNHYRRVRALDKLSETKELCLEIASEDGGDILLCQYMEGIDLVMKRQAEDAEVVLTELEKNAKRKQDSLLLSMVNFGLGETAKIKQNIEDSTERLLEALQYSEAIRDTSGAITYSLILAMDFLNLGDSERAHRFRDKAESYLVSENKADRLMFGMVNSSIFIAEGREKEIVPLLKSTMSLSKETDNLDIYANTAHMFALTEMSKGNFAYGRSLLREAIRYEKRAAYLFHFYLALAENYEWEGDCTKAADMLDTVKQYIVPEISLANTLNTYRYFIKVNACAGRVDSIVAYTDKLGELQDSINFRQNRKGAKEIEAKFRSQIQADSIALLSLETQSQSAEIKQQNTLLISGGIILALLGFLLFMLRKRNAMLRENEEEKSRLYANIAHELQTPLTLIKGFAQSIQKKAGQDPGTAEMSRLIHKNTNALIETTRQILDLSRSGNALNILHYTSVHLRELQDYLQAEFRPLLREKELTLNVDIPNEVIVSDADKLITVLKNLIINAVKHTPRGGKIFVSLENLSDSYQLKIADTGKGIPKEDLPKIFNRYYQAKTGKPQGGFGIGLAICREYTELLGGKIEVSSALDSGSTFTLKLPKRGEAATEVYRFPEVSKGEEGGELNSPPSAEDYNLPEILIVEDNRDICKYLKVLLEKDYTLNFVHNGKEALKTLEKELPKLILTDWMMPEMDGYELVKKLKSDVRYQKIPVLMLTAKNLPSNEIRALKIGVDDYLLKPFEEEELHHRLSHLLNVKEDVETNSETPDEPLNSEWLLQLESTILRMLNDVNLNTEMIAEEVGSSLFKINNQLNDAIGMRLGTYIREIRFWEARRMLETGEYNSVKAVALTVGFKNIKYFSRKFKERFGKYPSDYLQA